jgi:hypothetical protein
MINIEKAVDDQESQDTEQHEPDDVGGIAVQGFFKIFDPESGEVLTQGRA